MNFWLFMALAGTWISGKSLGAFIYYGYSQGRELAFIVGSAITVFGAIMWGASLCSCSFGVPGW